MNQLEIREIDVSGPSVRGHERDRGVLEGRLVVGVKIGMVTEAAPQHGVGPFKIDDGARDLLQLPAGGRPVILEPEGIFNFPELRVAHRHESRQDLPVETEYRLQ